MARYKIILNPVSNKGANQNLAPEIEQQLSDYGLDFDIVLTEYPIHATELARSAVGEGYDSVVAAGGDGTSNEVLNGIMLAQKEGLGTAVMGVLPIGRGNDFNFGLGNPDDWLECCRILSEGKTRRVDVGLVVGGLYPEGRYFGNQIGIGFDAVIGFLAAEQRITGFPGYLVAAVRTMFIYHPAPVLELNFDGETLVQPSLMVTMMNGCRAGGGFMMAPDHKQDDGLFDVCIADEISRLRIFPLLFRFIQGTQYSHPAIHYRHAQKVTVRAMNGGIPAHADGETICVDGQELSIELFHKRLEVFVSSEAGAA